jgi:predicted nucleic acid-binding protein
MDANDAWIAATAIAHGYPVVTQDAGFPEGIAGLAVIRA